jgi:PKHD-type hydroxylase
MILTFPEIVTPDEHRAILRRIAAAPFVDGAQTGAAASPGVKRNLQIARDHPCLQEICDVLLVALKRSPAFVSATYPVQLHSLLVSRYLPGMSYGRHVDDAIMGGLHAWRSDLSLTLFLNAPQDYDGGELAIDSGGGETLLKLDARGAACYPTGREHGVREVTRGERLVVVAWIQSLVSDPLAREALWDLAQAREQLLLREGNRRAIELITKTHANLLRRWAKP